MLYCNDMLLREPSANASAPDKADVMIEPTITTTTHTSPTSSTAADAESTDTPSSNDGATVDRTADATTAPTTTTSAVPMDAGGTVTESQADDVAPSNTSTTVPRDTVNTDTIVDSSSGGGDSSKPDVDTNTYTTNTAAAHSAKQTKATPLRPASATADASGGGSDSPSRFGFIPGIRNNQIYIHKQSPTSLLVHSFTDRILTFLLYTLHTLSSPEAYGGGAGAAERAAGGDRGPQGSRQHGPGRRRLRHQGGRR